MGKKTVGALSVIGIVLVAGAVVISKFGLSNLLGDATAEARVGDCLGTLPVEDTGTSAELVGCDSADARYVVVGRVDDRTEREVRSDRVCAAFAETEALYYMLPDGGGTGYVLCLKPVKK